MRQTFTDQDIEAKFRAQGFVIIPFLAEEDLAHLKTKLLTLSPTDNYKGNQHTLIGQQSFHITFFDANKQYKEKVFALGKSVFADFAKEYLQDFDLAQANVFLKPGGKGFVYPHQNLTIVDEEVYTSVSIWMPLQDTNIDNGTICLIPGSQTQFIKYRNTHVYWPYVDFFKNGEGQNYFVTVNVKAGDALIIDDRIVHYTPANNSEKDRWVFHSLWKPKEAAILFCDPIDNRVDIYSVEPDFWQFHPPGAKMEGVHPKISIPFNETIYSDQELKNILENLVEEFNRRPKLK